MAGTCALNDQIERIRQRFRRAFGAEELLVRSPGRVNLIGEHTDYNQGFVLPAAADKAIYLAIATRAETDEGFHFLAVDLEQEHRGRLGKNYRRQPSAWPDYLLGVIDQLQKKGFRPPGFNLAFGGDIPIGAGLSSSAALECGLIWTLNKLCGWRIDDLELVRMAQRAENDFVRVRCGIMDQFTNIFARPAQVLKLDCRSLEYDLIPFSRPDLRIVVCDTRVRRQLAASEYNIRRQQCESGVKLLQRHVPAVGSLRDVSLDLLGRHRQEFDPVVYRRCAYVIRENERVDRACLDLRAGDWLDFGHQLYASHAGLRDEYQVSCSELDTLVDGASSIPGVIGARMMGAGFGGCTINLVEEGAVFDFSRRISRHYLKATGQSPLIHVIRLEGGTGTCEKQRE